MANAAKNVAVITYQFSVVVKSIEKGLRDQKYDVMMIKESEIETISSIVDGIDVFVMYLPENILGDVEKIKPLFLLCDILKERRRRMILIGVPNSRDTFMRAVPGLKDFLWIDRPVDMYVLMREIEKEGRRLESALAQKRLLIIDDDPLYAKMVCEWLKDDYQMDMVADGMQGISWLATNKVDLILLDYEMPVIDGPKILEMLKMHKETSSIPVIFLTGIGTKESIARVMGLKPQGYVLKTTTKPELLTTLKTFFEKQEFEG